MDKKYLTKFNAIFLVVFLTVILVVSGCSCNPFDNGSVEYLTKKMNEIPIECRGYKIIYSTEETIRNFEGTVTVKGVEVNIKKGEGKNAKDYIINYNDKEIHINNEYMREKSNIYVYIHDIWKNFEQLKQKETGESRIFSVYGFDDKLFIVTNGLLSSWTDATDVLSEYPITLYEFNIETEEVLYAGYLNDYTDPQIGVVIKKTEEK